MLFCNDAAEERGGFMSVDAEMELVDADVRRLLEGRCILEAGVCLLDL